MILETEFAAAVPQPRSPPPLPSPLPPTTYSLAVDSKLMSQLPKAISPLFFEIIMVDIGVWAVSSRTCTCAGLTLFIYSFPAQASRRMVSEAVQLTAAAFWPASYARTSLTGRVAGQQGKNSLPILSPWGNFSADDVRKIVRPGEEKERIRIARKSLQEPRIFGHGYIESFSRFSFPAVRAPV